MPSLLPTIAPNDLDIVAVFLIGAFLFITCHYGLSKQVFERWWTRRGVTSDVAQARGVLSQRWSSGWLLGVGSVVALLLLGRDPMTHGIWTTTLDRTALAIAVVGCVVPPITWLSARNPGMHAAYPEIRRTHQAPRLVVHNAVAWVIYLAGYELFFRGFLLFALRDLLGAWPALGATTALYVLAHLHKGAAETFGCLLMGMVFGLMTLYSGSFLAAFVVHVAIAVGTETVAARSQTGMRWWSTAG